MHATTRRELAPRCYFREIGTTPILSAEEEIDLCERIQDGDAEARDHLVRANLRLVVKIARGYHRPGVELDDMVAEGNLGLIRAAEAFDPEVGTRFSTYAAFWIKQSIKRLIVQTAKPIRLPSYMNDLMVKWERMRKRLQGELKRTPTAEEIAEKLQLSPKKLKIIRKAIRIYNAAPATGTTDQSMSPENALVDHGPAPDQFIGTQEDVEKVLGLLDHLDQREATVLRLRFGIGGEDPLALAVVGERLGLTRERVRQIEKEALQNLAERLAG
ncbi:MAG TPA: RNA polymerase sigma factor RpoD/SigA [Gemmataceae bacterium]|nr:RNA polymerase sigma factor RpoD/SigA [Gemmataceae bacterium]